LRKTETWFVYKDVFEGKLMKISVEIERKLWCYVF